MKIKRLSLPFTIILLLSLALCGCIPSTGEAQGWPGVSCHNGTLYTSSTGKIAAIDPSAQSQEWSHAFFASSQGSSFLSCGRPSSAPVSLYNTATASGDLVHVGAYNGKVYALNTDTGVERWIYPKEGHIGAIVGNPLVLNDTVYVCSADDRESDNTKRSRVYALNTAYGEFKWKSDPLGDKLWASPIANEAGDTIYVSTFDGHIYALSAKDGSQLPWVFNAEAGLVSSPALCEDTMFVGSFNRNLYAVRIGEDKFLWKFAGGNWLWATPLVSNGVVYAGCLDGKIYALNSQTGDELWEFDAQCPIVSPPILVNDLLVVACDSGKVSILESEAKGDNKLLREIIIPASVQGSICAHEGIVYIYAQDNYLYALDINKGEITWKILLSTEQEP